MFSKQSIIVYLTRAGLLFFFPNSSKPPLKLDFPPDTVKNLELISASTLDTWVMQFIAQSKVEPSEAILLLSEDTTFQKVLVSKDPLAQQAEIKTFIDEVPLDNQAISHKVINVDSQNLVVAQNKIIADAVKNSLAKGRLQVTSTVSVFTFGGLMEPQKRLGKGNNLTGSEINQILSSKDLLKSANFSDSKTEPPSQKEVSKETVVEKTTTSEKISEPKMSLSLSPKTIGLGVFFLAVLAALVVIVMQLADIPLKRNKPIKLEPTGGQTPAINQEVPPATTSAPTETQPSTP